MTLARGPLSDPTVGGIEAGMTLVELLVYLMLSVVIAGIAGTLLFTAFNSQRAVASSATIVQSTKLITQSVTDGISNSLGISIASVGTSGDQILRAKSVVVTANGTAQQWECLAWYYSAAAESVYASSNATGEVPTPTFTGNSMSAGWTLLGTGIQPQSGNTGIFSGTTSQLNLDLTAQAGKSSAAAYSTSIVPLPVPTPTSGTSAGTLTCF